jgi:hypothetical protein
MAVDIRIRADVQEYADRLAGMNDKKLVAEGLKRGIPEADTLPRVTLQDALVQKERDELRIDGYQQPQTGGPDNLDSNPGPDAEPEAAPKD